MNKHSLHKQLNIRAMAAPIATVILLCLIFLTWPDKSNKVLQTIRYFLGNKLMNFYLWVAIIFFVVSIAVACSKYGKIRLGNDDHPRYPTWRWGTMIFTSTMSADVIFYSLSEWSMYGNDPYIVQQPHGLRDLSLTYSLFHWGPLAWGFYIMLAVAFGYMLHVKKDHQQRFSEACRPLIGRWVDHWPGRLIDFIAIVALVAGTATTFSMSMPLLSAAISKVFGIPDAVYLSIIMLLLVASIYTITVIFGTNGIAHLATICSFFFLALILYFFLAGGQEGFIIQNGAHSLASLVKNFPLMAAVTHPALKRHFMLNWTVYYWSYWMVWSVATPFFIAMISRGRTIRNLVFGGYFWGLAGTYISFLSLGGYGISQQLSHRVHVLQDVMNHVPYAQSIIAVFQTLPYPNFALILLVLTMVGLYSTVFDGITMVVSAYSYRYLAPEDEPDKRVRIFWAITFILMPIALILMHGSIFDLQSVAIIAALPIGIVMMIILVSFLKDIIGNKEIIRR